MKPERKRNRLKDFDYSNNNAYFITINSKNNICWFGDIINDKIELNELGSIVENCWYDLENHYFNCILDEFIIMPNHVHAIVIIDNEGKMNALRPFRTGDNVLNNNDCENNEIKIHGLSEMMRAFKSFSSRRINEAIKENIGEDMKRNGLRPFRT